MENLVFSSAEFAETIENLMVVNGTMPIVVTGNSMNPFLIDGRDIVWLRAHSQTDLKRGKILLFKRSDGTFVLHRVRKVLPDNILLMNGDAQTWCEKIETHQVVAVVTEIERNSKKRRCGTKFLWHIAKPLRPVLLMVWRKAGIIYGKNKRNDN